MSSKLRSIIICIAALGWLSGVIGLADPGTDAESGRREMWESLSEEEKEKLRTALRDVWTDPAVITARDEVKSATEAYQKAIREAVAKADPSVVGLMTKAEKNIEGRMHDRIGGPPSGRSGMFRRGVDYPISPPGFMEKLTPEERAKFREAEVAAKATPEVKKALAVLKALQKQDEEMRRKRLEAHRQMRQAVLNEMVKTDPSLKELQERLDLTTPPSRGGEGRPSGAGSGTKGKSKSSEQSKE